MLGIWSSRPGPSSRAPSESADRPQDRCQRPTGVGATPSPARPFWRCPWCRRRCFDVILVRTAVPFTVLVQSVLRSTAVSYHPILHPGHSLQAGQRTCYTSWWCRKHTRAGLVARGARMGNRPTRIRPARLWRREWPSVASRPPRGRVPWRRPWSGTRDGAN